MPPSLAAHRALIFASASGNPAVAEQLSRSLHELGFECELAGGLPSPVDSDAVGGLRRLLSDFKVRSDGRGIQRAFVHPGTTAWAERPEIATLCQELGLVLVAPPARVLAAFADRLTWMSEAARQGIPNLVLSAEPIHSVREIERFIEKEGIRFPFVLRSVRCSGFFGNFVLQHPDDLKHRLPIWIEQLRLNLGEVILFVERHIEAGRRITVPFCRFADGQVEIFPTIDGSLQSRFRKLIEFCPAETLADEGQEEGSMLEELETWTARLARQCGFVGVGSFEFMVEANSRAFVIDGTARLSSTYHLWERVAGTSAVAWQLAALEALPGLSPDDPPSLVPSRFSGGDWSSAIALRLLAEDPLLHLPQPGMLKELSHPRSWKLAGAAAEIAIGARAGSFAHAEPLALLFVGARDRKRAIAVTRGILDELWFAGALQTNERFLQELISHPWVREGIFHAGFVDEEFIPALRPPPEIREAAFSLAEWLGGPEDWIVGDSRLKPGSSPLHWSIGPETFEANGSRGVSGTLVLEDGRKARLCAYPVRKERWSLRIGAWFISLRRAHPGSLRILALAPGRVHSVLFREGAVIPAHEPAIILDAGGRLIPHALPREAIVRRWAVSAEQEVAAGDTLAELEHRQ